LQIGIIDRDVRDRAGMEMRLYFTAKVAERRTAPGDDLISYLLRQRYPDDTPFKDTHVLGSLGLLLIAGIDTTWSGIGSSIWHLAPTPADRDRLSAERRDQLDPDGDRAVSACLCARDDGTRDRARYHRQRLPDAAR